MGFWGKVPKFLRPPKKLRKMKLKDVIDSPIVSSVAGLVPGGSTVLAGLKSATKSIGGAISKSFAGGKAVKSAKDSGSKFTSITITK